ncbi:MAG: aminotransferase class V-fold PLP-dependent enzyme [Chloroflexi bacterium]|nr:aminotransferase class V-fold PLP-dependent enzyme [Chloroflexota bacterium]
MPKPIMDPITEPNDFPGSRDCSYLDAANICLTYRGAQEATTEWFEQLALKGAQTFDGAAEESVFDSLHAAAARLFNAQPDDIAVGASATELLASLAWALAPGPESNIVGVDVTFPSTIYPWSRVARSTGSQVRFARATDGYVRLDDLIALIDRNTAVVCISEVEYSTGQRYDVAALAEAAHKDGALLIVDASQSAGAIPIDVAASGVDALVTASYKWLCGPFGVGVMYLAPHLQDKLDPGLVGFRSHKNIWDLDADRLEFSDTASRFEFSTMAYGCAVGLTASIDYLSRIDVGRIFDHNLLLADQLIAGLLERNAEILPPRNSSERTSIVAARIPGADSTTIAEHLKSQQIIVSARRDAVRFSPHLYNNPGDVTKALDALDSLLTK